MKAALSASDEDRAQSVHDAQTSNIEKGNRVDKYQLSRVSSPIEPRSADDALIGRYFGGSLDWSWGIPGVFRALASPHSFESVPAMPRGEHANALGYWGALHYLLLHRLGWANPARGLRWWYESGKPTEDPTLALVAQMWGRDGMLDRYLYWLLSRPHVFMTADEVAVWGMEPETMDALSGRWQQWMTGFRESFEPTKYPWFSSLGEGDPLHLTGHGGEAGIADPRAHISVVSATDKSAIFVTRSMDAWHFDLSKHAMTLPDRGDHWRVDVLVKPVGFVGVYRRSRITGLWFSGRHRFHTPGN